ncbi:MAG: hypothetical protein CBC68_01345 [Candidatus Marinimicrobia bacterium TMED108]|nr:MAG: hypothetical protein CBC68_01345 [Candidatus Marinimicrobia bacterium TMED108]|tara:strand:- start:433 stop:885 length:453 start_codon:yes stop_codon:yes gene_type:complete
MKKVLYILMLTIFFGCTPILKPVMLENLNKESTTLDNLVEYLQKNNMKVINEFEPEIEERSTPIGTITLVTLETDWYDTGIFLEDLNSNGFVKYKVRFGVDMPDAIPGGLGINPRFGYKDNGEIVQKDKAPKEVFEHINKFTQKIGKDFK